MVVKIHGYGTAGSTVRVIACLHELGVEYDLVRLDFGAGAHKKQPYLSLNPFGLVPAFEDGDLTLFESRAITRYLGHKYKGSGTDLLRLDNPTEAAIINTWMEVEAHQFNGPVGTIIQQLIRNPYFGRSVDEKLIEIEAEKLQKVLDVYEERLKKCQYLAGENFTMADLHHIPSTFTLMRTSKASFITSRPHVNAWWNKITSRPTLTKVFEDLNN